MSEIILRNKIKCNHCDQIIESYFVHDFKWCECGKVAVDGGCEYRKRTGDDTDYTDLSVFVSALDDVEQVEYLLTDHLMESGRVRINSGMSYGGDFGKPEMLSQFTIAGSGSEYLVQITKIK